MKPVTYTALFLFALTLGLLVTFAVMPRHAPASEQSTTIAQLQSQNAQLRNEVEAATAQLAGDAQELQKTRDACDVVVSSLKGIIRHMQEEDDKLSKTPRFR